MGVARMDRAAPDLPVEDLLHHPHLPALLTYHGQVFHLALVSFWIEADTIGGAALLIWIPAACITAVYWSRLGVLTRESRADHATSTPPPAAAEADPAVVAAVPAGRSPSA